MGINFFLDSANPRIWEKLLPTGIFTGITTNPTLLRENDQPCELKHLKYLSKEAESYGCKEIHLQAWGNNFYEIEKCSFELSQLETDSLKVYIKLPITRTGSEVARKLIKSRLNVTFTACFHAHQVLIASALGANYVAPYLGRINDKIGNGIKEVSSMQIALQNTKSKCKILAASIRRIEELLILSKKGIDTFTLRPQLAEKFFQSNYTIEADAKFTQDANSH